MNLYIKLLNGSVLLGTALLLGIFPQRTVLFLRFVIFSKATFSALWASDSLGKLPCFSLT